jgi:hypothetical protein
VRYCPKRTSFTTKSGPRRLRLRLTAVESIARLRGAMLVLTRQFRETLATLTRCVSVLHAKNRRAVPRASFTPRSGTLRPLQGGTRPTINSALTPRFLCPLKCLLCTRPSFMRAQSCRRDRPSNTGLSTIAGMAHCASSDRTWSRRPSQGPCVAAQFQHVGEGHCDVIPVVMVRSVFHQAKHAVGAFDCLHCSKRAAPYSKI